jgi:esterase/lipase superfamily enzyme
MRGLPQETRTAKHDGQAERTWFLDQYSTRDIHLATECGPWENSGPTYQMSAVLASRGIAHHLDDWGPKGGHEWPYWHHQMWEYVGQHF